jgi:hypothetical protein
MAFQVIHAVQCLSMVLTSTKLINLKTSPGSRGIISLSLHKNSLKVFYKQPGMRKNVPENLMSGFCKYQLPGKDEFKNLNVIILYNFNKI